MNKTFEQ